MRALAIVALAVATFITAAVISHSEANAVVCARGVYRAVAPGRMGLSWCIVAPITDTAISRHAKHLPQNA